MIIAEHIGRLGNNMFQIAAAIGYARKFGYEWAADPRSGLGEPYSSIHEVFFLRKGDLMGRRYNEHPSGMCDYHAQNYDYCHYDFHPFKNVGDSVRLFGFWQSWKYFHEVQEEIKKTFQLDYYPDCQGFTSIHVRRGDYVQHAGSFPPVTGEYIARGMEKIRTGKYMVFSDDIQWCKENLGHLNNSYQRFEFAEGNNDKKELSLMASCDHHIIANSSFSWWAAYLGHNPDRVVVSPSHKRGQWYGLQSGVKKDCVDLIPEKWIQIEFR